MNVKQRFCSIYSKISVLEETQGL